VHSQNLFEISFGNAKGGAFSVRIGIVGAPVAIKNTDIAKPDPWFDIRQCDMLARQRG
jgi:hypothetical protein